MKSVLIRLCFICLTGYPFLPCFCVPPVQEGDKPPLSIEEIRTRLPAYTRVAEQARDKDITVFIGNTGSGKSTLFNLLSGFKMRINCYGEMVPEDEQEGVAPVLAGTSSVTRCPYPGHSTEVGDLYDCPGFFDTRGTVDNILNAAAIRGVLTYARSVRIVLVTTNDELNKAGRGMMSREFDKTLSMFEARFLQSTSCIVIVNAAERGLVESNPKHITDAVDGLAHMRQVSKRVLLKQARVGDEPAFIEEMRATLLEAVRRSTPSPIGHLNIAHTLCGDHDRQLVRFFKDCMELHMKTTAARRLQETVETIEADIASGRIRGPVSSAFQGRYSEISEGFQQELQDTEAYTLLHEVCANQYEEALTDFHRTSFQQDHRSVVNVLVVQEKQQEVEAATREQISAETLQKAAENEAQQARQQSKSSEISKKAAEEREKQAQTEASAAQADATKSQEEKEQAHKLAREASEHLKKAQADYEQSKKATDEKLRRAGEETKRLLESNQGLEAKMSELKTLQDKQEKEYQQIVKDMEARQRALRTQIEEASKKHDADSAMHREDLLKSQVAHERSMREMAERHTAQMASIPRGESGGGFCTVM